jgi:hypothetical protein
MKERNRQNTAAAPGEGSCCCGHVMYAVSHVNQRRLSYQYMNCGEVVKGNVRLPSHPGEEAFRLVKSAIHPGDAEVSPPPKIF